MKTPSCTAEDAVLAALRSGDWPADLRRHVDRCPACAEVLLVAGALAEDARSAAHDRPLPDPGGIWLDARLRARRLEVDRATRPIAVMRRLAAAGAAAAVLVAGTWLRNDLAHWLAWLRPPSPDVVSALTFLNAVVLVAACGSLLALAAYALVTSHRQP